MTWDDFYDGYCNWSESTLKTRISLLEDIGSGEEVVDVILNLSDDRSKAQLVRKAMRFGVVFTRDDYVNLYDEFSNELYTKIGNYGGFYTNNPYFNENDFDWDEFCTECADLPVDMLLRCIYRIEKFGDPSSVVDAILSVSSPADDALYERAIACGVKFTKAQKRLMGIEEITFVENIKTFNNISDEKMKELVEHARLAEEQVDKSVGRMTKTKKRKSLVGKAIGIGALIGIFKGLFCKKKHH